MRLLRFSARNYRSVRDIHLQIGPTSVFVGRNGVGKSNLYGALQLLRAAATGELTASITRGGGMDAVLWAGRRRKSDPVRIQIEADFENDASGTIYRYVLEAGLPIRGQSAAFWYEPQVKVEKLGLVSGGRFIDLMERNGPAVFLRDDHGRRQELNVRLLASETALSVIGQSGQSPEVSHLRAALSNWRFYHGFRSDRDSPLRQPCHAITSPSLDEDGANLAAVFATLAHIRQDRVDIDEAVADALEGAGLDLPFPDRQATFGLSLPEFPLRLFSPAELSDGQLRFIALAGALLAYRLPPLIALNEPETSLHVDMLPALARMVARAAQRSQVWIVAHSSELAKLVARATETQSYTVLRDANGTQIEGLRIDGTLRER